MNNDFLYCTGLIEVVFEDYSKKQISGSGTCFFLMNKDQKICLLTNRHVLDLAFSNIKYKDFSIKEVRVHLKAKDAKTGLPTIQQSLLVLSKDIRFHNDLNNDVAAIIDPKVINLNGGAANIDWFIPYDFLATETQIATDIMICDMVAFPGFPPWFDKVEIRPILRTGTISSDPRFDYHVEGKSGGCCLAYEAFSYGGSSGSPVFATLKGFKGRGITCSGYRDLLLIGINAGHLTNSDLGKTHSGISYLYKATTIRDLIDL